MESRFSLDFLDPEKIKFSLSPNGFLLLEREGGDSVRVILNYAFPLEITDGYVGVYDGDFQELGMIRALSDFSPEQRALLEGELQRRYYCPKIEKILSIKNKMGVSLWNCVTREGENITFTVKDAYKSMIRVSETRFFVVDRDGARYEIEDSEKLDKKSFHKLELYL